MHHSLRSKAQPVDMQDQLDVAGENRRGTKDDISALANVSAGAGTVAPACPTTKGQHLKTAQGTMVIFARQKLAREYPPAGAEIHR